MTIRNLVLIAIFTAILTVAQLSFSWVMGINLVFPLLLIYTYTIGFEKTMFVLVAYLPINFMIWGYPTTTLLYAWTFTILISGAFVIGKFTNKNEYAAAGYTFIYFILFGLFSAVQDQFITDVDFWAYWMQGALSDLSGAVAGFITTLLLLNPLSKVINQYKDDTSKKYVIKKRS